MAMPNKRGKPNSFAKFFRDEAENLERKLVREREQEQSQAVEIFDFDMRNQHEVFSMQTIPKTSGDDDDDDAEWNDFNKAGQVGYTKFPKIESFSNLKLNHKYPVIAMRRISEDCVSNEKTIS